MRRRARIILGGAVAALALLLWASRLVATPDPVVHGRPLSTWLDQQSAPSSQFLSAEATAAVRALGAEAIPTLLAWLSRRDSTLVGRSVGWGRTLGLPIRPTQAWVDQDRAYRGFVALGPAARPAWPRIVDLILRTPDRNQRELACYSIPEPDPPTMRLLVEGTRHPDPAVRINAAYGLMTLRDAPDEISLPALERLLGDPDPAVRAEAARSIRLIMSELRTFVAWLRNPDPDARRFGARHIGPFRSRARAYLPDLEGAAADPDPSVRLAVAEAIRQIRDPTPQP